MRNHHHESLYTDCTVTNSCEVQDSILFIIENSDVGQAMPIEWATNALYVSSIGTLSYAYVY